MKKILIDDISCTAAGAIGFLLAISGYSSKDVSIVDIEGEMARGIRAVASPVIINATKSKNKPIVIEERGVIPNKYVVKHRRGY